VESTV